MSGDINQTMKSASKVWVSNHCTTQLFLCMTRSLYDRMFKTWEFFRARTTLKVSSPGGWYAQSFLCGADAGGAADHHDDDSYHRHRDDHGVVMMIAEENYKINVSIDWRIETSSCYLAIFE